MKIVKLDEKISDSIVVCLGFFGCMHKGHTELLSRAKNRARMTNSKVALFTFCNNHLAVLNREASVVYTYEERLVIYESLGIDYVITAMFDETFKKLNGKDFLSRFNRYDLDSVFCGFDHRCGSDGLDANGIRKYFKDIPVYVVEPICENGEKISTTLLRKYIADGLLDKANALLSEPFFFIGNVIHGRGVGKTLGFPTANIAVPEEKLLPAGVYGGNIDVDGKTYKAIINIGGTPTFEIVQKTCEAHLLDYNGDLYGKKIKISLTKYLRPTKKFRSSQSLSMQLQLDKEEVLYD